MSNSFVKFVAIVEIGIHQDKLKELDNWGVEPDSYLRTQVSEHLKDKGLLVKCFVNDCYPNMYEELSKTAIVLEDKHILSDIENEILDKACIGGRCDD